MAPPELFQGLLPRNPSWRRSISSESIVRQLKEDRDLVERAPSRVLNFSSQGSNFPAFAFTINAVLGAGIVTIPYAFAQVGLVTAGLILVFVTYISALGMRWIVEASARADRLEGVSPDFKYATQRGVTELCGFFFGPRGNLASEISLVFYGISSMFMYAAVFAETCAATLPSPFLQSAGAAESMGCDFQAPLLDMPLSCRLTYWFWLALFALVQAALATRNLSDQVASQLALSAMGMLSLALMLGTLTIGIFDQDYHSCRGESREEASEAMHTCPVALVLRVAGLCFAVCTLSSAQMAQFGTPVLTSSCGDKLGAPRVFAHALSCTCFLYLLYGSLGALYFGFAGVEPLITVLWRNYRLPWDGEARVSKIIGTFITVYPAVTVSAAFPLNAVATGNALLWAWCDHEIIDGETGKARIVTGPRSPVQVLLCLLPCCRRNLVRECDVEGIDSSIAPAGSLFLSAKRMQYFMRALVMVPALLLAGLTSNLGTIIEVSSLAGNIFAFVVPPALQLASRRRCEDELDGKWRTPYTLGIGSGKAMAWTCLSFGLVASALGAYGAAVGQS